MKKQMKTKKTIDNSNRVFIIFMTIAMIVLLIAWIVKDPNMFKKGKETGVTEKPSYNKLNEISVSDALELIESDALTFIYIGYEGCASCDKFTPNLVEISSKYDMKVYYINIKKVDIKSKEWASFTKLLTEKVTLELTVDGKSVKKTKTIGKFLKEDGYTPSFVVLRSNKYVSGHIGALYKEKLETFLDKSGFAKNS